MYKTAKENVMTLVVENNDGDKVGMPYRWMSRVELLDNKTKMTLLFGHTLVRVEGKSMDNVFSLILEQKVVELKKMTSDVEKITSITYRRIGAE